MTTLAPVDEGGVAQAVAEAAAGRTPLLVEGAGSKQGMLRPVQAAQTLSTRNLSGITLYSPKELVMSARAGTPIAEIEAAAAAEGQHVIAEPPDLSALLHPNGVAPIQTLGGVVATNLSGPRRIAWGAVRDHVLGVRAVNGEGEVVRSGGRVLKNVTGLDLCKLLSGSHGTLGVMTEITIKVLPAPEATGTLMVVADDPAAAVRVLAAGLRTPYGVSGAAWLPAAAVGRVDALPQGRGLAMLRIEEFAPSVTYRLDRLRAALGGDVIEAADSRAAWRAVRDAVPLAVEPGDAVWRVSVRPSAAPAVLEMLRATHAAFLDWGGGLVWLAGPATAASHAAVAAAVRVSGGTWTLMRGDDALRTSVDVVPAETPALAAITRRVKAALDPAGILNPGRLYAGL